MDAPLASPRKLTATTMNMSPLGQNINTHSHRRRSLKLLTSTPDVPVPPSLQQSPYLKSPVFSQVLSSPTLPSEEDELWLQDTIPISKSVIINPTMVATEGGSTSPARRGSIVPASLRARAEHTPNNQASISLTSLTMSVSSLDVSERQIYTTSPHRTYKRRWSATPIISVDYVNNSAGYVSLHHEATKYRATGGASLSSRRSNVYQNVGLSPRRAQPKQ